MFKDIVPYICQINFLRCISSLINAINKSKISYTYTLVISAQRAENYIKNLFTNVNNFLTDYFGKKYKKTFLISRL